MNMNAHHDWMWTWLNNPMFLNQMKHVMFQDMKSKKEKQANEYLTKQYIVTSWMNAPWSKHEDYEQVDLWWIVELVKSWLLDDFDDYNISQQFSCEKIKKLSKTWSELKWSKDSSEVYHFKWSSIIIGISKTFTNMIYKCSNIYSMISWFI